MSKKHIVMARNDRVIKKGLDTGKGHLDFKGKSMMYVDDDIAEEVNQTQGLKGEGDVWVHEDPRLNWSTKYKADGVHSYFFGTSKKYAEGWERIFGTKRSETAGDTPEVHGGENVIQPIA